MMGEQSDGSTCEVRFRADGGEVPPEMGDFVDETDEGLESLVDSALEAAPSEAEREDVTAGSQQSTADIAIVGVGGGGLRAVNLLRRTDAAVTTIGIDVDRQALSMVDADAKVLLTDGLEGPVDGRTGVETETHEVLEEAFSAHLDGAELCVVVTGLGGGGADIAGRAVPLIDARPFDTVTAAVLPFSFQGHSPPSLRARVKPLQEASSGMILFDNDTLIDDMASAPVGMALNSTYARLGALLESLEPHDQGTQLPGLSLREFKRLLTDSGTATLSYHTVDAPVDSLSFVSELVNRGSVSFDMNAVDTVHLAVDGPPAFTEHDGELLADGVRTWFDEHAATAPAVGWSGQHDGELEGTFELTALFAGTGLTAAALDNREQ